MCSFGKCPVWNYQICAFVCVDQGSPIVIDTDGEGYRLTGVRGGVRHFDFYATGHPPQMAWTAEGSTNALLVLDRNGNGAIDDCRELFGNCTDQPPSADRNGFAALAVFDLNHDGVIDAQDAVFSNLRLWIDANHDGISQPGELYMLPALGVRAISVAFIEARHVDRYGNSFRYKARVYGTEDADIGRVAYDVFFTTLDQ